MLNTLIVLLIAAIATAGAAYWVLRAYREAGGRRAHSSLIVCGAVGVLAFGLYLAVGRPELPDAPYDARLAALKERDPSTYTPDEALAILSEAAREAPADPLPHFYSGEILFSQRRPQEAARAYDAALRRDPENAEAMVGLGRSLVALEQGRMSPEALAAFQRAAELNAEDPAPWLYQAIAAMEADDGEEARRLWSEAYRRMAEEDPRREMALRMSREAGR